MSSWPAVANYRRRIGRFEVTYQSQFVANSYLLLWVMPQSTWNYCRKWKFMCYQTSTDNNKRSTSTWMRSGIVNVSFSFQVSELDIIFNLVNQHYSKGVGDYIVYNKEHVYARILFTNDQTKWTSTSFGCFSRSTAFIVDFIWEVNCTQLCNNYRPITTVQYRR